MTDQLILAGLEWVMTVAAAACVALAIAGPLYLSARKRRMIEEARLAIDENALILECKLLRGTVCKGELSHGFLMLLTRINEFDHLPLRWKFWQSPTKEELELRTRLHKELSDKNDGLAQAAKRLVGNAVRIYRLQHPFRFYPYVLWVFVALMARPFFRRLACFFVQVACRDREGQTAPDELAGGNRKESRWEEFKRLVRDWLPAEFASAPDLAFATSGEPAR